MTTPTSDIDEAAPRISGRDELVAWFEAGSKPEADWRIGTEHEKFGFIHDGLRPLPYAGDVSVRAMLEGMQAQCGWDGIYEGETLIGLKTADGGSISLEPGGQFELSGPPLETIHQTCNEVNTHLAAVRKVADPLGIGFLGLGFSPVWSLDETPMMPKGRYDIMRAYMARVGRLGREMMFRTCTVQTNLDFGSEPDMVRKMQVSLALQPVATALFANSPFTEGRPNGYKSYRAHVWTDLDPDRTGMLPFVFEDGFGFERYVDYALDVPMYFVRRQGRYVDVAGHSFREFLEGRLEALPGERPAMADFEDHLSTIFPEVRLKRFLEMRGADSGPWSRLCALPAFWVGLLYDSVALDEAYQLIKGWTAPQREMLRRGASVLGFDAPTPDGRSMRDLARDVVAIARGGLNRRSRPSTSGDNETGFLVPLEESVLRGLTPADELLAAYHGEWQGRVEPVFKAMAY